MTTDGEHAVCVSRYLVKWGCLSVTDRQGGCPRVMDAMEVDDGANNGTACARRTLDRRPEDVCYIGSSGQRQQKRGPITHSTYTIGL